MPTHFDNWLHVYFMCFFQVNCESTWTPKNLVTYTLCIWTSRIFPSISSISLFLGVKIIWVFRTFRDNLLHCNHSCTFLKSSFSWWNNISISLPVINILVSSANNTEKQNSDTLLESLIYHKNNMGPNIVPCGTPQWFFHGVTYDHHKLRIAFYLINTLQTISVQYHIIHIYTLFVIKYCDRQYRGP